MTASAESALCIFSKSELLAELLHQGQCEVFTWLRTSGQEQAIWPEDRLQILSI